MSGVYSVTRAIFAVVALCATPLVHSANDDSTLHSDLERLAQRRILFGHQSVGLNLLDGINQLAMTAGVPLRIVEVTTASSVEPASIGHIYVTRNGDPFLKLRSFEQAMGDQSAGLDIALVKFCYIDFTPETDVKALFGNYQSAIARLKTKNPQTTFVHVTAPLTVVQSGFKANLKRLLGRTPNGTAENLRREEYNTLLRNAYQTKEPVFDLARIESTAPNGTAVTVEWKGKVVPVMLSAYTDDGGHLNAFGKRIAARKLISILAAIPNQHASGRMHH